MYKSSDLVQDFLFPPSITDFFPENDIVRLIPEIINELDLKQLHKKYSRLGQNAYHPAMMLAVLFYTSTQKILSSREIAKHLHYDVRFIYLSGNQRPDFRTIWRFRKENRDFIQSLFKQIVNLCQSLGMVTLEHIAIDGSKFKTSASGKHTHDWDYLDKRETDIDAKIAQLLALADETDRREDSEAQREVCKEQLGTLEEMRKRLAATKAMLDENPNLKNVNLTDPDSRLMKHIGPGFNGLIAVDSAN